MLTTDQLIDGLKLAVHRTAIDSVVDVVNSPPGRRPRAELVELSEWYKSLDDYGREQVNEVVRLTADFAVLCMLAVLDGSLAISNEGDTLSLSSGGRDLNPEHDLHWRFRGLLDQERSFDALYSTEAVQFRHRSMCS
jgi:hypothetical protein